MNLKLSEIIDLNKVDYEINLISYNKSLFNIANRLFF